MVKYSVIIPVYNTEKYLSRCLESILEQSYSNFEIIVINDGSTDNSLNILNSFAHKFNNIRIINQENKGLSVARNIGIQNSTGDYFLLVDSDDYIEKDLFETLNRSLANQPDLVRFQIREIDVDKKIERKYLEAGFFDLSGNDAFQIISKYHYVELACCYLYKTNYYKDNNFKFAEGKYHEDFGLIPLVIVKAKKVNSICYIGYNYIQHNGSIMNNSDYLKTLKKAYDVLEQYKWLVNRDENVIYRSFLANSVLVKLNSLNGKDYKKYLNELRKTNVFDNLLVDTIPRKIKKILIKINPKWYLKMR